MNFLFITQYYPPEPGSASLKMAELAEHMANKGHTVSVVTGFPNYPYGKLYKGYKIHIFQKELINKVIVIRVPLYITSKRQNFIHRMINHASFMISAIYGGLAVKKPNLIYFYSPPIFLGFSAFMLRLATGTPTIAEINDLWPQAPIAMGIIKNNFVKKMSLWFERFVYVKTNYLFFYSKTMRDQVLEKVKRPLKTEWHPLWIDTGGFTPKPEAECEKTKIQLSLSGKFVIMYAGYIGLPQGLDALINCAKQLKGYPDILFVLVGDGPAKEGLIKKAKNEKLENMKFIPFQPPEKIPLFLSAADVLFAHLDPAPHRMGTIPAKVLAYMSMGKPMLVAAQGEVASVVEESKAGVVTKPRDTDAICNGILQIFGNRETGRKMGEEARRYAIQHYDKNKVLENLEGRLIEIAKGK